MKFFHFWGVRQRLLRYMHQEKNDLQSMLTTSERHFDQSQKEYEERIASINEILYKSLIEYRIRRCPVPLWIWKNLGLWKNFIKKFYVKNYNIELTVYYIFLFFFLFKYDEIIRKQPSSSTFGTKVVKF